MEQILNILPIIAGFVMILAAFALAWRQKVTNIEHVVVFALGGVLAGISGFQLSAGSWTVNIGQLKTAASQVHAQTDAQQRALSDMSTRVDHLQAAIQALQKAATSRSSNVDLSQFLGSAEVAKTNFLHSLNQSKAYSSSTAMTLKTLNAEPYP